MAVTERWARNRAILAGRLEWPDGALEVVAGIEDMYGDYACYWGTGRADGPQVGYYAMRKGEDSTRNLLFGAQADDLIAGIQADIQRVADEHAKWLNTWRNP
jgi:hypothetical protein